MNQKERVRAAIEHRESDLVPVGEWIIDYEPASLVLGRPTYLRGKARLAQALWAGRRDEIVESTKRDTVELVRRLDLDLVCVNLAWPRDLHYDRPEQVDEETCSDGGGFILGSSHSITVRTPRENIIAMLEAAGRHPTPANES